MNLSYNGVNLYFRCKIHDHNMIKLVFVGWRHSIKSAQSYSWTNEGTLFIAAILTGLTTKNMCTFSYFRDSEAINYWQFYGWFGFSGFIRMQTKRWYKPYWMLLSLRDNIGRCSSQKEKLFWPHGIIQKRAILTFWIFLKIWWAGVLKERVWNIGPDSRQRKL